MNLRSLPHLDLERLLVSESRIRYPFVWIQFPEIYQSLKNTAERERAIFLMKSSNKRQSTFPSAKSKSRILRYTIIFRYLEEMRRKRRDPPVEMVNGQSV